MIPIKKEKTRCERCFHYGKSLVTGEIGCCIRSIAGNPDMCTEFVEAEE